jgi:hypothetical protein
MDIKQRLTTPVVIALLLVTATFGIAYGVHIIIDGNPADWPAPGPLATKVTDPQEASTPDDTNVSAVWFTADTIAVFGRIDTYANTRWTPVTPPFSPYVVFCLDTDNNTATGRTVGLCRNMPGVDYEFQIVGNNGSPTISLLKCDTTSCAVQAATTSVASQNNVTEFSAKLSDMGIDGANCTPSSTIPFAVYFDNADFPPDDNVPDSGTATITLSCPTAVRLVSSSAAEAPSLLALPWAGGILSGLGLALGLRSYRRRQRK